MESSVLYKSADNTIVVIDIPRSLEEAQVLPGKTILRHIVSTKAVEKTWHIPEPKKKDVVKRQQQHQLFSPAAAVAELMTLESVRSALETVRDSHDGPWCLPRVTHGKGNEESEQKRPNGILNASASGNPDDSASHPLNKRKYKPLSLTTDEETKHSTLPNPFIPELSHHLLGTIESRRDIFLRNAPQFDLIILDPPWPSRSVKRKSYRYDTVYTVEDAGDLLSQIPVASHLKGEGLVAVWVTNKTAITDLLTAQGGIFAQWGLEPIGEWIWLKVTSAGEPVFDVESTWRKPWERLLIARKRGSSVSLSTPTKVILGVPDIHSRKPNLRGLFEDILPQGYLGLEVFARNLSAGWWSWGNEVLFFQQRHHWVAIEDEPTVR